MTGQRLKPSSNVLITGATGLIGGELVRELARLGTGHLWNLVRPIDGLSPARRLAERMLRSDDVAVMRRAGLEAVAGDVLSPDWGLARKDHERITEEVDVIIHCAADTSFLPRKSVREINVLGMRHLIGLAASCRRSPLVVYMSTACNAGRVSHRSLGEDDGCQPDNEHHNDYTRSKAVAEQMLRESGLEQITLRPSIVLSAGLADPTFARTMLWFVPLLAEFECLPVDPRSRLDIVSASFVVDATIRLLASARSHDCYHLSAGEKGAFTTGDLCGFVNRHYGRNVPLRLVLPEEWTELLRRRSVGTRTQRTIFAGLRHYLPFLNMDVVFDNARMMNDLASSVQAAPVTGYLSGLLDLVSAEDGLEEAARP